MTSQKQFEADRNYAEVSKYFADLVISKQTRNRRKPSVTPSQTKPSFAAPSQPKAPSFTAPSQPTKPKRSYKFQEISKVKLITIDKVRNEISNLQTKEDKLKTIQGYIDIYLEGSQSPEVEKLLDELHLLLNEISKNESFAKFSQRVPSNLKYNFAGNYSLDESKIPSWENLLKEIQAKPKEEQLVILENWRDVILNGSGDTKSLELLLEIDRYLMKQAKENK